MQNVASRITFPIDLPQNYILVLEPEERDPSELLETTTPETTPPLFTDPNRINFDPKPADMQATLVEPDSTSSPLMTMSTTVNNVISNNCDCSSQYNQFTSDVRFIIGYVMVLFLCKCIKLTWLNF